MYQRILVPVDGSPTSKRGLEEAIRLARLTSGRLRLFHVIDELSFELAIDAHARFAGDWLEVLRANGRRILDEAAATAKAAGTEADAVLCDRISGSVQDRVNAEADKWPADLIVLGTHGRRGVDRVVMGSSAERILRHASVAVLLVRAPETESKAEPKPASTHVSLPSGALAFE